MKAIKIARVSTEEQQEAGNSLPAQVERMGRYCENKGFEDGETFSFDESAYKAKRTEFDSILKLIQQSKEKLAVCFDKVDRFSRNVFDKRVAELYELATQDKIELHFVSDNLVITSKMSAAEKFHFGINLGLAKYYSDAISDNTKRAFEQKRRRGEWTGHAVLGYAQIQTRNENGEVVERDIVPDPERAHLITKMFDLFATGQYSITTIQLKMTELGLRSPDGRTLWRSNYERFLKDTFYFGVAYSKKYGSYPHRYERLISEELFEKCRSVREGRSKTKSKELSKAYIFKGLLKCKKCGCLMSPEIAKRKYIYYSCTNAKGTCKRVYIPENTLLKSVFEVFKKFESIPDSVQKRLVSELRNSHEGEVAYHQKEISRVRTEYDRIQKRIESLLDLRLDMSITSDVYDKKLHEMKERQYRLNIELEEHTKADHQYHIHVSTVLDLSRRMGEIFESSEPQEKRQILSYLLQNPWVEGKILRFDLRKPFSTVLELAQCPTELRG